MHQTHNDDGENNIMQTYIDMDGIVFSNMGLNVDQLQGFASSYNILHIISKEAKAQTTWKILGKK